ncbi:MAG: outer membrane lipoprotein carrier protein LolA [Rikenellaceae bacterium]|nr:outer membrane lipoprotein carrier protein LolA [Rikenellaceae bacterium]
MFKKITAALFFSIVFTSFAWASDGEVAQRFGEKLREQSQTIRTIRCEFTQVRHMSVLAGDARSSGRFYYQREGNICLEFDRPAGDMIVMNGERFKIVTDGRRNVVSMNSNPMLKQLKNMLTACMTGDIKLLEAGSEVTYQETPQGYRLTICPSNRKARNQVSAIVLTFDKGDMSLVTLRMEEPSGDYTEYTFTKKIFNSTVDDSVFDI